MPPSDSTFYHLFSVRCSLCLIRRRALLCIPLVLFLNHACRGVCTFVSVLCIRCILYNIMTVEPSSVRKQNKQKNGNTPSHESRQHCAHDACYNTMHVTALCICVGWCFQRVSSTVVFSGRLQRVSSTDVFNRCLQRVSSTGVFNRCLQWVYSTGVFSGCHPELTMILS